MRPLTLHPRAFNPNSYGIHTFAEALCEPKPYKPQAGPDILKTGELEFQTMYPGR